MLKMREKRENIFLFYITDMKKEFFLSFYIFVVIIYLILFVVEILFLT